MTGPTAEIAGHGDREKENETRRESSGGEQLRCG
jgi:hypothetical protein